MGEGNKGLVVFDGVGWGGEGREGGGKRGDLVVLRLLGTCILV